ncbi:hypothetical protein N752_21475 [Desulforamulus aquiferis]|nr:DegV family protein [Desulforamulus aquiferis]RYD02986.1 hypothetical protein N752_21475 [Desulforamulus aquiferis]
MQNFVILTDSCCDLPLEIINSNKLDYVPLTYQLAGKEYFDDFGHSLTYEEFYQAMKAGNVVKTSQATSQAFYNKFLDYVIRDIEILYIGVSTGLSGTYNSANLAQRTILEDYPAAKITLVNTLTASMGQGLLVLKALGLQKQGRTLAEIVEYLTERIKTFKTFMTVNDLHYLKIGGRISTIQYSIGSLLKINPMLRLDQEGKVGIIDRVRGRKRAIQHLVNSLKENVVGSSAQIIAMSHGNCIEEAYLLKDEIEKNINTKEIHLGIIGPVVGAYGGPGALAVF